MKLKLFVTDYNGILIAHIANKDGLERWTDNDPEHVRVSETVEVDFPEINKKEVLKEKIKSIDRQISVRENEIKNLEDMKKNLLCLEYKSDDK